MLVKVQSKGRPFTLVRVQTWTVTMEISVVGLRKLGINLSQDPAIPILGIYPNDFTSYYRDTCSSMLIATLLIITRNWK